MARKGKHSVIRVLHGVCFEWFVCSCGFVRASKEETCPGAQK